jgi:hypothetical protein
MSIVDISDVRLHSIRAHDATEDRICANTHTQFVSIRMAKWFLKGKIEALGSNGGAYRQMAAGQLNEERDRGHLHKEKMRAQVSEPGCIQ